MRIGCREPIKQKFPSCKHLVRYREIFIQSCLRKPLDAVLTARRIA